MFLLAISKAYATRKSFLSTSMLKVPRIKYVTGTPAKITNPGQLSKGGKHCVHHLKAHVSSHHSDFSHDDSKWESWPALSVGNA